MKTLLLALVLLTSPMGASEADHLIQQLPAIRSKALADTAELQAGSTTEMVDAATTIRDRLLPVIVTLESKLEGRSETEVRAQLERDLEGVSRDAYIRGHSDGWGGTAVSVDAAWAAIDHLEARASWCVWQLMKDSTTFNLEKWRSDWNAKANKAALDKPLPPATRPESDSEGGDKPQPESEGRSR